MALACIETLHVLVDGWVSLVESLLLLIARASELLEGVLEETLVVDGLRHYAGWLLSLS